MEDKMITTVRRIVCSAKFSCLLFFFLLLSGCSSPNKQLSYFNMLDEHKRTVGNKQAAEKFWTSVRPVSTLSDSHYKLGRHYQQKGKYDKAINEFAKALRNDPSYCKAHNGIAMSYDALRRCEPAHKSYTSAIRCAPNQAYVYNNYGCSSLLCGDYAKGIELLHQAERLAGDNSRIRNNLKIARMVVNNGTLSDHLAARQEPIRVSDPEPTASTSKNETSTTNPVADIPIATLPDVSPDTIAINDPPTENVTPSPTAEVSVERPLLFAPQEAKADSDATATKLLAEVDHLATRQETIPASDPEQTESMPKSETITTNPVADIPIATLPDVSPDTIAIDASPVENTTQPPPAEVIVEKPLLFSPEEAKEGPSGIKLLAEVDHFDTRQEPIPDSKSEQTISMTKSETNTPNPGADIPIATRPDIPPGAIAIIDPPAEYTNPPPPATVNVETPMPFSSPEEPKARPAAVKILAEKTKVIISPTTAIAGVEVSNGNGITGMARRSATFLRKHGIEVKRVTNAQNFRFQESVIFYREGYLQAAQQIAAIIPGAQNLRKIESMSKPSVGIRVLLGRDLVAMRFPDGFSGISGFAIHKDEDQLSSTVALADKSRQY